MPAGSPQERDQRRKGTGFDRLRLQVAAQILRELPRARVPPGRILVERFQRDEFETSIDSVDPGRLIPKNLLVDVGH